jgi:hypothetical protein
MTNSVTVKEAYKLIDEIPVEKLKYVIQFLRGAKGLLGDKKENNKQKEIAFNNLKQFKGILTDRFDYDKKKFEYMEEKYGRFN